MDILKKTLKMFLELLLCHVCTMHEDEALALDAYNENLTLGSLSCEEVPYVDDPSHLKFKIVKVNGEVSPVKRIKNNNNILKVTLMWFEESFFFIKHK